MFPVDLSRQDRQVRALQVATDIARLYNATIVYTAVSGQEPSSVARNANEFRQKLDAFAKARAEKDGVLTAAHPVISRDPASRLNPLLIRASIDIGADLIVIGSHFRGRWARMSHSARVAAGATASVLIVRPKDGE